MGSEDNRLRSKWQDYSGRNAGKARKDFLKHFKIIFEDTEFRIRAKPNEFSTIYVDVILSEQELSQIYTPTNPSLNMACFPIMLSII